VTNKIRALTRENRGLSSKGGRMPYQDITELPRGVRDNLPPHAQEIYMKAYDNSWEEYKNPGDRRGKASREETAGRVAWAAVKKEYFKNEQTRAWEKK
jgi:cation transport regulator